MGDTLVVVDRDTFLIGRRGTDLDLVLNDTAVSRRHAVIERTRDGDFLRDLGSTNGVAVNGAVVSASAVRPGDVVSVGPYKLIVTLAT